MQTPLNKPLACCLFCKKIFSASGRRRWCRCKKAQAVRNEMKRTYERIWRKRNPNYTPPNVKKLENGWKKCISCDRLTPNRFGRCSSCLENLENSYNLEWVTLL